ncbi:MAG: hotdog fold thioesterase [Bifidobacteriaceae bacterium]|nr:hotdog fold thioesterase [Bifidobacteriaceae bacterium]
MEHQLGKLAEHLGIIVTEFDSDQISGVMPVAGNTQPHGLLHGGASLVLAETLASLAANTYAAQFGQRAVAVTVQATHHHTAQQGQVHGIAQPIHLGRKLTTHQVIITDDAGTRLSTVLVSNALI